MRFTIYLSSLFPYFLPQGPILLSFSRQAGDTLWFTPSITKKLYLLSIAMSRYFQENLLASFRLFPLCSTFFPLSFYLSFCFRRKKYLLEFDCLLCYDETERLFSKIYPQFVDKFYLQVIRLFTRFFSNFSWKNFYIMHKLYTICKETSKKGLCFRRQNFR